MAPPAGDPPRSEKWARAAFVTAPPPSQRGDAPARRVEVVVKGGAPGPGARGVGVTAGAATPTRDHWTVPGATAELSPLVPLYATTWYVAAPASGAGSVHVSVTLPATRPIRSIRCVSPIATLSTRRYPWADTAFAGATALYQLVIQPVAESVVAVLPDATRLMTACTRQRGRRVRYRRTAEPWSARRRRPHRPRGNATTIDVNSRRFL